MRTHLAAATLALALALHAGPAPAQQADTATPPAAASAVAPAAGTPDTPAVGSSATPAVPAATTQPIAPADPLEAALANRLAGLKSRGAGTTERMFADQLIALYAERSMKPIWVNRDGLTAPAELVLGELAKAGDWGLDSKALAIPERPEKGASPEALAATEMRLTLAVLSYARQARGGRVDPSQLSQWLDQKPRPVDAKELLGSLATASDPAEKLRGLNPRHAGFEALRQAWLALRSGKSSESAEEPVTIPSGPLIKPGDTHEHVALVRKRLKVPAEAGAEERYDSKLEAAVRAFMLNATGKRMGSIGKEVRAALNSRTPKPKESNAALQRRLLVNMERWRWLPEDLGKVHVWNNLPEFETRVVKNGKVVHQERIIIGKPDTQTPVFSDRIRFIVFRPEWGVPPSLKVKDLLPKLQSGDYDVLERRNMRISLKGKMANPEAYDWSRVDIRKVPIVQEPGDDNPLGTMKFMFPNKHDVYMHDTPAKNLFNGAVRMHSSGCIRVRNPKRFASLLFAEGGGGSAADVDYLASSGNDNTKIDLERAIPVHNVYFTAVVEEDGKVRTLADIYGHDQRIAAVLLDGRSVAEIAAQDPALKLKEKIDELATSGGLYEDAPMPSRRGSSGERQRWSSSDPYRGGSYRGGSGPRYYNQQRPPRSFFDQLFGN